MPETGLCDLHCHLLPGVDDGARTMEEALEMARLLVELGFSTVAPSPHARPEYAPRELAEARRAETQAALAQANVPLELLSNAENFFMDEGLLARVATPGARKIAGGPYLLIEAPYTAPLPALLDLIFRLKLKGVTPLIAHPERCLEFEKKGRAAEAVAAGAALQLDVGALIARYGPPARKRALAFLDDGLYAVAATDLHSPVGGKAWVERSLEALHARVGAAAFRLLLGENPRRILAGTPLES